MTSAFARRFAGSTLAVSSLFMPALVLAHSEGHGANDALAGFLHPLTGSDHLLAMFAVGLWAVRLGRGAMWTLPTVFPLAMIAGAALALRGVALPAIEPMIAVSVTVFGIMVAIGLRLPILASALLVGAFAIFHGYAHAMQAPSEEFTGYAIGFVSATAMLHVFGLIVGALIMRRESTIPGCVLSRVSGSLIAVAGAALLIS